MVKSGKTFTLDLDILMKHPTSELVNRLLREHYGANQEECHHQWSNAFSTPGGLMKECILCHKTEEVQVKQDAEQKI